MPVLVVSQSTATVRKAVERQVARYVSAMGRKDLAAVEATMSSDFQSIDRRGRTVDRVQAMRQLKNIFTHAKKVSNTCQIRTFRLDRANAHLTAFNTLDIDVPNGSGKVDKFHIESTTDEVWIPVGTVYKISRSKVLAEKTLLNGKG